MAYMQHGVQLSDEQKRNLAHAGVNRTNINIKLAHDHLRGSDVLNLTQRQIDKIKKCIDTGVGLVLKLSKSQIQSMNRSGGIIPLLLAGLGALATLAGGASAVAKTVIDKRAKDRELQEQERHNRAMESVSGTGARCTSCNGTGFAGSGVFLDPYLEGSGGGLYLNPYTPKRANRPTPFLEERPISN